MKKRMLVLVTLILSITLGFCGYYTLKGKDENLFVKIIASSKQRLYNDLVKGKITYEKLKLVKIENGYIFNDKLTIIMDDTKENTEIIKKEPVDDKTLAIIEKATLSLKKALSSSEYKTILPALKDIKFFQTDEINFNGANKKIKTVAVFLEPNAIVFSKYQDVSEEVCVHEMLHYLTYVSRGMVDRPGIMGGFDEILTQMLAEKICNVKTSKSAYRESFFFVEPVIAKYGYDVFDSYFVDYSLLKNNFKYLEEFSIICQKLTIEPNDPDYKALAVMILGENIK